MKAFTQDMLLAAFDPIDRPLLSPASLEGVRWEDRDYFAWSHPQEALTFLVASLPERDVGVVLRTSMTRQRGFCDLCCGVDREVGTTLVMAQCWSQPRTSFGFFVCGHLDCSDSARGYKWIYRMGETITAGRRVERLQERLERLLRRVTGLEAPRLSDGRL